MLIARDGMFGIGGGGFSLPPSYFNKLEWDSACMGEQKRRRLLDIVIAGLHPSRNPGRLVSSKERAD